MNDTYTRSYYENGSEISVPKNYNGTAFTEEAERADSVGADDNPAVEDGDEAASAAPHQRIRKSEGLFSLFKGGLFGGTSPFNLQGGISCLLDRIGTEELLIIGVALFLLLSHSHDIETALMLAFLIFVH